MIWLQENWIIAVVGLVVAVVLLWWLFGRAKPAEIAPPTVEPAKPAKPLEPAKPEIIAAEPARFKPVERAPQPTPPAAPPPTPAPAAEAPPPSVPDPAPAPVVEPAIETIPPAPKAAAKPRAATKPAAKKAATKEPAAKPAVKPATKTAAKPAAKKAAAKPAVADAAAIPEEPTVPPPPAAKPAPAPSAAKTDNLQLLKGVGPKLVVLLNGLGVTSFQQIADWTDADIARVDAQLGAFQGRIARDNIVDQAGYLARGDKAGFEAKYGALGGEL